MKNLIRKRIQARLLTSSRTAASSAGGATPRLFHVIAQQNNSDFPNRARWRGKSTADHTTIASHLEGGASQEAIWQELGSYPTGIHKPKNIRSFVQNIVSYATDFGNDKA
jgi:hypothetical protein